MLNQIMFIVQNSNQYLTTNPNQYLATRMIHTSLSSWRWKRILAVTKNILLCILLTKLMSKFLQYLYLCCSHKPASFQLPVNSVVLGRRLGGNGVNVEKLLKRLFRDKAFEIQFDSRWKCLTNLSLQKRICRKGLQYFGSLCTAFGRFFEESCALLVRGQTALVV